MRKYFQMAQATAMNEHSNYAGNGWGNFVDPYNYANGGGQGSAKASLPFSIQVVNSTASNVANVVILGSNSNLFNATNFGNPAAITITMDNGTVDYTQFLESIKSQPFMVGEMYIETIAGSNSQPFQTLSLAYTEPNGRTTSIPVSPRRDPMQNQNGVTIVKHSFPVNAFMEISTTILAETTVLYSLYPMSQLDLARTLSGQSIDKPFSKPNLSQFQLPQGQLAG